MRSPIRAIGVVAILFCAESVSAMGVQVSYQVLNTGASFTGPNSSGTITGGTVSFHAPSATNTSTFTGPVSLTQFTLTGPSGFFMLLGPVAGTIYLTPNGMYFPTIPGGTVPVVSGSGTGSANLDGLRFTYYTAFVSGFATVMGRFPATHGYNNVYLQPGYSQEVRSLPEPNRALGVAVGLAALGAGTLRWRRARRSTFRSP